MQVGNDPGLAWLKLLRDPCAGNLTQPCYSGTDAGYLVRTTDNVALVAAGAGLTVGNTYACSIMLTYSPIATFGGGVTNHAYLSAGFAPGGVDPGVIQPSGTGTTIPAAVQNFINSTTTPVARYRPVASCLRWVPTGPYAARQGVVGLGYSAGLIANSTSSISYNNFQALMQHYAPNGSEAHEVRWLPTIVDERFTTNDNTAVGGGTMALMLRGVDGVAGSATGVSVNGYVEVTTVWEWTPAAGSGLVLAPKVPPPYSAQQIIARISDLGGFLFEGVGRAAYGMGHQFAKGTIAGGSRAVTQLLSRGVGYAGSRSNAMLIAG